MKKMFEDRVPTIKTREKENLLQGRERFREQQKIITLSESSLESKNMKDVHFTNFVRTEHAEFFVELKRFTEQTEAGNYQLHLNENYDLWEYTKEDENLKSWKKDRISNILGAPFEKLLVFKHKEKEWRIFCNPDRMNDNDGYPLVIMDPYHLMRPVSYKGRLPQDHARHKYRKRKYYTYSLSNLIKDEKEI